MGWLVYERRCSCCCWFMTAWLWGVGGRGEMGMYPELWLGLGLEDTHHTHSRSGVVGGKARLRYGLFLSSFCHFVTLYGFTIFLLPLDRTRGVVTCCLPGEGGGGGGGGGGGLSRFLFLLSCMFLFFIFALTQRYGWHCCMETHRTETHRLNCWSLLVFPTASDFVSL
ncbi:hypothetical protein BZA05DRAFT_202708 [Tricharina praecox]|uniref:uncharacterized protein n=1 Tax=Tricharina praecox TaxID=43433 RepID=UPI002220B0DD|nr:uncharacterized protein BZA05DRAFT_202708 [Tricharina praecox]KAI5856493.1 hypothetical protein BZA05DRAFT_202708 [Tricharina praecox]